MNIYSANGLDKKTRIKNGIKTVGYTFFPVLTEKVIFKKIVGFAGDFNNPVTFQEKLVWLKQNYRNIDMVQCADKYNVRNYLKSKGLNKYLNELYAVYDVPEDINWDKLPNQFILKATHGSNMMWICKDKTSLNIAECEKEMRKWLRTDYSKISNEWHYKDIPRKIVCEKYLEGVDGLIDYKVHCFNGKPAFIQCDTGRFSNHFKSFYDLNWRPTTFYETGLEERTNVEKPEQLHELLEIAEKLALPFPYVRVDFYIVEKRIIFGELTFFHKGGHINFNHSDYSISKQLGNLLTLPMKG